MALIGGRRPKPGIPDYEYQAKSATTPPHESGAITRGRGLMAERQARGVNGSSDPGAYGFNVDFVNTPNGPQRVRSGTQPANALPMRAGAGDNPGNRVADRRRTQQQGLAKAEEQPAFVNTKTPTRDTGNFAPGKDGQSLTADPNRPAGNEQMVGTTAVLGYDAQGRPVDGARLANEPNLQFTKTFPDDPTGGTFGNTGPYPPPSTASTDTRNTPGTGSGGNGNTNNTNTTPGSTATGANPDIENNVPGSTGTMNQQREDDYSNFQMQLFYERDAQLGGAAGVGGNNIRSDGSYNIPDSVLRNLFEQYQNGADLDSLSRMVQSDETVEGRLAGLMKEDNPLNRYAIQDAQEQAAAAGLIGGSSGAAGAALRASRQAMLPIAQQDAAWYGQTAKDNMDAGNRDRLADQEIGANLIGQDASLRANLYEQASDRAWRSKEANHERIWKSMESRLGWMRSSVDREDQQDFQWMNREDEQTWNAYQNQLQREFSRFMQDDSQEFEGTEAERNRMQQRSMAYFEMMFSREGMLTQQLNAIYSNTNLTPAQQATAANNARTLMQSLWESWNTTMAQGIPEIWRNPYGSGSGGTGSGTGGTGSGTGGTGSGTGGTGSGTGGTTQPPPAQPPDLEPGQTFGPGTPGDPNVTAPLLRTDESGVPTYARLEGFDEAGYPIWRDPLTFLRLIFDAQGNPIVPPPPPGP